MKLKNKSLSIKLLLSFVVSGLSIILVMYFTVGMVFRQSIRVTINDQFQQHFNYISSEIGSPPDLQIAKKMSDLLNVEIIITGPQLRWSSASALQIRKPEQQRYNRGKQLSFHIQNPPYTTTFIFQRHFPPIRTVLLKALASIIIVLVLVFFLLRHILSPIKIIQNGVKRIASGDLQHRISIQHHDDLGLLSAEINAMADDIQQMLEAKQQLLLAISHELRSPLTRAKVALSLMQESTLKIGLEKDISEMQGLITELLEAERLNNRHQALNLSLVDINTLIEQIIEHYFPDQPILQLLDRHIPGLSLDKVRWQFVIKNLISNALMNRKQDHDEISISTNLTSKHWCFVVADQGVGIPAQHISSLTEPFYRLDSSRQRETGGYGLGLYIIKMIIEAHGGQLHIESEENVGTKVIIKTHISNKTKA